MQPRSFLCSLSRATEQQRPRIQVPGLPPQSPPRRRYSQLELQDLLGLDELSRSISESDWDATKKVLDLVQKPEELKNFLQSDEWEAALGRQPTLLSYFWPASHVGLDTTDLWPLLECAMNNYTASAEILLTHGSPVDFPKVMGGDEGAPQLFPDGYTTPLMHAAGSGHHEILELLLHHGADPNLADEEGDKAYEWALAPDDEEWPPVDPDDRARCQGILKRAEAAGIRRTCTCPWHERTGRRRTSPAFSPPEPPPRRDEPARAVGDHESFHGAMVGLPKRANNLSEIYRPPTEVCFVGSFEELRLTGRQQSRWLLVNIQSPTEFASQQLNADTWTDEGLRAVLGSSFLLWQRYFEGEEGATYCRHYLQEGATFPHIGLLDPVTGQLVESWQGFITAERCGRG